MKTRFIFFAACVILVNCKEAKPELTYKYSDKAEVINCTNIDSKLFNEALYNFEENLNTNNTPNLSNAYRTFLRESTTNRTNYNNITNQHSLEIYEALKQVEGLWIIKNNELSLNYNHEIFQCIGNNIQDNDLKTTFNALLSTNSMSIRMLKDVLITKSSRLNSDKYLATYIALELYYSKLSHVDLSQKQDQADNLKPTVEKDPHAGHNHD